MKNKENYQKTFAKLTASPETIQEVLKMKRSTKRNFMKKSTALVAASLLLLGTTGAAYAATGGDISSIWKKVDFLINGEEATAQEYADHLKTTEEGDPVLSISGEGGEFVSSISIPKITTEQDVTLDNIVAISDAPVDEDLVPFTLKAEGDILYLIEDSSEDKIDITKEAASDFGYSYTWVDVNGAEQNVIIFGTAKDHLISLTTKDSVS